MQFLVCGPLVVCNVYLKRVWGEKKERERERDREGERERERERERGEREMFYEDGLSMTVRYRGHHCTQLCLGVVQPSRQRWQASHPH